MTAFRVPGRVNLIGGHVDFHEGLVACAAVDLWVSADVVERGDGMVIVRSGSYPGEVRVPAAGGIGKGVPEWGRLVVAVLDELAARGRPPTGFDADITSTLPIGGGLSSSAAFGVLVARIAASAADWDIDPTELALAVRDAEERATGVSCGVQDQLAVVLGGVRLLDCRDLTHESLSLPAGTSLVVVDSGVSRVLEGSPWSARRSASFAAAEALGYRVLRDVFVADIDDATDPLVRHVVGEIGRVRRFADALHEADPVAAGVLMVESHESSRVLWRSSTPELDALVDAAVGAGAYGARLTGGGFGGCIVALVPTDAVDRVGDATREMVPASTMIPVEVVTNP